MQAATTTYLKFIPFENLKLWDVKIYTTKLLKSSFPFVKLNSVLSVSKMDWVEIEDDKKYPILGVRAHGKGVYINRIAKGSELPMKKYQKSKANHLYYCKVRTVNGQWGIVYPKFENSYGSSNMQYLEIDETKVKLRFFELLLSIKSLTNEFDKNAIGADGRHFTLKTLLSLEIPLPSLSEQEAIVANYYAKIREAEELERQAEDLEDEIERYIFKELDLDDIKEKIYSNKLKIINSSEITRWGVDYISGINSAQFLKSKKFKNEILKNIVQINPSTTLPKQVLPISFVPMECISDDYGEVIELREKQTNEAKGYTKFIEGDLLWARITPCMQNGKSAIVKNLKNNFGCGSTEFHVIRNISSEIELEYIYQILRLKTVLSHARSHFTGSAGQQRVPKSFLEELMIPIPPYNIQKAISAEINKMKALKKQNQLNAVLLKEEAQQEFEDAIFEH